MKYILLMMMLLNVTIGSSTSNKNVVSHTDAKAWCENLYYSYDPNTPRRMIRECTKIVMKSGYVVVIIIVD